MSKKTYMVRGDEYSAVVKLVVDTAVLTPELATEINSFWCGADSRVWHEDGDVVRTVIRLFGLAAIRFFQSDGGAIFFDLSEAEGKRQTQHVLDHEHEGWPPLDQLGIVITGVNVAMPDYEEITLEEVA